MEQKEHNKERKDKKLPAFGWKFVGVILLTIGIAAGLFLLWAWASYHMRFSAGVIRLGILFLYILPCLFGGRLLARTRCARPFLWGAGLGAIFYGILFAASLIMAIATDSGMTEPDLMDALPLLLSVLSGMIGAILHKKDG